MSSTARISKPVALQDPAIMRWSLIGLALGFIILVLFLPLISVFLEALRHGLGAYFAAVIEPDARAAILLTLEVAAIAVPLNIVFGLAGAWAIAKFEFRGKSILLTLVDLPFSVSPVISGLIYVLLYGAHGWFGPTLDAWGIKVIFNITGQDWCRTSNAAIASTIFSSTATSGKSIATLRNSRRNRPSEMRNTLALCTAVTFLPRVIAHSKARRAMRSQHLAVTRRTAIAMSSVGMNSPMPMCMLRSA